MWYAFLVAPHAFLIVAQPHSSSESLMVAMGRLLPRPHGYQSWYAFRPLNTTEARFWNGWRHSDKGTLAPSQLEWMCGPSLRVLRRNNSSKSERFRTLVVLKNHVLPLPENLDSMDAIAGTFAARGAFLFRDVTDQWGTESARRAQPCSQQRSQRWN